MPTAASSQLPAPSDWEEFESLCADLFAAEWEDPHVVRHGRRGQRQHGIDLLTTFILATTADDDAPLQEIARRITQEHSRVGLFDVHILGWGKLSRRTSGHDSLLGKHYQFVGLGMLRAQISSLDGLAKDLPEVTVRLIMERFQTEVPSVPQKRTATRAIGSRCLFDDEVEFVTNPGDFPGDAAEETLTKA